RCCNWSKTKEWANQRQLYKSAVSYSGTVPLFGHLVQHVLCFISKKLEIRYNTEWTQKGKRASYVSRTGMNCLAIQTRKRSPEKLM
ncbi:hypothetical protein LDENG_00048300, partial [Lucifuga dentata]